MKQYKIINRKLAVILRARKEIKYKLGESAGGE
jgi:hypothetical protein